jgi:hypothetical protein
MNERKAAMIANKVYAAAYAKQISAKEALKYLDKLEAYMSAAQLGKFLDFSYAVQHNPDFFA